MKPPKYRNKKTVVDGINFDSRAESRRYAELKLLERAGKIASLEVHPVFPLVVDGVKVGKYISDFAYFEKSGNAHTKKVVEDVKSKPTMTPVYRLKKRLLKALYGIDIKEINA